MYETHYHRASSVDDAVALFARGQDAKFLAGGQTLLPVMKQRLAQPSDVIDLSKLKDLIGVEATNAGVLVKGATTHYDVATNAAVQKAIPALASLASQIGDPAVRYRGTIGGSLANNDPAADYPAAVLALNATVKTNKRTIAADEFFKGLFSTALQDGEIITAVSFPVTDNPASRFALTGVFVARAPGGDVRVAAVGASQNGVMRVGVIEAALKSNWSADALDNVKVSADGLLSDIHGTANYRANLIKVMAQRAVTTAG
jgi:aerobic carbon-monoxide dehydrogenase medium subunit